MFHWFWRWFGWSADDGGVAPAGFVCGTPGVTARVSGTAGVTARVSGTPGVTVCGGA